MAETNVVETPAVETPVVETPAVDPPIHFNPDGTFGENWQGQLDEGLREDNSLRTFKNVNDLAKSFVNTKSMVGKNTMEIPTDVSSELVWDAFYKAGGRPDTVDDYNLKAPEDFPEEALEKVFPAERLKAWQERFFKSGISKKAADRFIADFAQDMLVDLQTMKQAEEAQVAELVSGLSTDWGAAMEQKKHLSNIAVDEGTLGDIDFKERLLSTKLQDGSKLGNNPDFVRYSSNLGGKFSEGKSPDFTAVPTPGDIQEQIDKITSNPLYLGGTHEERMKLAKQVMVLREKMKPTKTT